MSEEEAILVVEDDTVDVMNIKRAFSKNQMNNPLYFAKNGVEAFKMLKDESANRMSPYPKIILLDINMPIMNGHQFMDKLRQDSELADLTVFVLSTSDDEGDMKLAYEYNVAGYIVKAINFNTFVADMAVLKNYLTLSLR